MKVATTIKRFFTLALGFQKAVDTPHVLPPSGCSKSVTTFATGPIIQGSPELWDNVLGSVDKLIQP